MRQRNRFFRRRLGATIAITTVAVLASFGITSVASAAPAAAASAKSVPAAVWSAAAKAAASPSDIIIASNGYIVNPYNLGHPVCLGMSYTQAYVTNCNQPGGTFTLVSPNNGQDWLLVADNTGDVLCLTNFNFFAVYPAQCTGSSGQYWEFVNGGLYNDGTGKYLATDFTLSVYLIPTESGESWYYGTA